MKRFAFPCMAILIGMAVALSSTSCIYDAPDDIFFRTLWESDKESDTPGEISDITLEFLCSNAISIKTGNSKIVNYGTYDCNRQTAVFYDLSMEIGNETITFIDAYRSGDTLELRWHSNSSSETQTTVMHRLSAYK